MSTRCNRGFYCRSYCLLNMLRASLCPPSGAQEYYTVVAACGISCCGFQVAGLVWSRGLCVRFAGCCSILQTGHVNIKLDCKNPRCQITQATKFYSVAPRIYGCSMLLVTSLAPTILRWLLDFWKSVPSSILNEERGKWKSQTEHTLKHTIIKLKFNRKSDVRHEVISLKP